MALGQAGILENISTEGHLGGDIDGVILESGATLTVGGGRRPDGTFIMKTEWIAHKGKAITCKAGAESTGVGASKGYFSLSGILNKINGKLLSVDDDGRGTIGCIGMNLLFKVPEKILGVDGAFDTGALLLDHTVIGQPIIGAGDGLVYPVGAKLAGTITEAIYRNARGFITDYDNAAREVKVNLWAY